MILNGQKVSIRYTIKDEEGYIAANNLDDKDPQDFYMGRGQMLEAVEEAIREMEVGEEKLIHLDVEQAFGPVDADLLKSGLLHKIPEKHRKIGNIVDMEDHENNVISARIHDIQDSHVFLDFNHPLAGQKISFDIKLIAITDD
tara:strand:- start:69939 stop:70367 length:429 start_codon:yes stop_codon:yes gene_type:complete